MFLPLEILNVITTIILEDDTQSQRTLRSFAMVCSQWLPAARYHIFEQISIHCDNVSQFLELVSVDPTFIRSSRCLEISGAGDVSSLSERLHELLVLKACPFTTLTLRNVGFPTHSRAFRDYLLADFIRSTLPNITVFQVANIFFGHTSALARLAGALKNVHTLTFVDAFVLNECEPPTSNLSPLWPALLTINVGDDYGSATFIRWLSHVDPPLLVKQLAVPDVRLDKFGRLSAPKLLNATASSLTCLCLTSQQIDISNDDLHEELRLPPLPNLRSLTIINLDIVGTNYPNNVAPLSYLFATLTSPFLESITVQFTVRSEARLLDVDWAEVDKVLCCPGLSLLKTFRVDLQSSLWVPPFFAERLPLCRARSILMVNYVRI